VLKYVWARSARRRHLRSQTQSVPAQETVIVESRNASRKWQDVTVHPDEEFRNHFERQSERRGA
jgi:hypothetical protein